MTYGGAQLRGSCFLELRKIKKTPRSVFSGTLQTFDVSHTIDSCFQRVMAPNMCFSYSRIRVSYYHARTSRVSHAGGPEEAHGVQGILEAYTAALNNVQLAGPTLFTEVLQTAMARANRPASQTDQRYDVLLILTDGIINDMQQVFVCVCVCAGVFVSLDVSIQGRHVG